MKPLMLHMGAKRVTPEELRAIVTPEGTKTWTPIAHARFLDSVEREMTAAGLEVISRDLGLWQQGLRFFGVLTLAGEGDYTCVVGLRNSNDRMFKAGIALGTRVFVCDNLAFSNDVVIHRAHTSGILRDLPGLISRGINQLVVARQALGERIGAYQAKTIEDWQAHDFLVRCVDRLVLPVTSLPGALQEWRRPSHEAFRPRTVWSLFNAVTEVSKGTQAQLLMKRTEALHGLADQFVGLVATKNIAPVVVEPQIELPLGSGIEPGDDEAEEP